MILKHYAKLLWSSALLIFVVILIMFFLLEAAPGDPIQALVGNQPVSEEFRQQITALYGLDRPVWERFMTYVGNIFKGDLGYSFATHKPVVELIVGRLGNTLLLTIPSLILSSIAGILLGATAAWTRSKTLDGAITYGAIAGFSIPSFWLALLLIIVFSVQLHWLPSQGMSSYSSSGFSLAHLILPVVSLAVAETAFKVRIMRTSMIEVLGQDFIDTARSKGLSPRAILTKHGILNSMLPMVSVIGYSLSFTIAGSVLIEKVFSWPGMGLLLYDSIQRSDNMVVMGILFIVTVTVVVVNILTDVVYGLVDPRVRARFRKEAGAAS